MTTGTYNTFLGRSSGSAMTTGSKNAIIGQFNGNQGGLDIRTSSNNIVLSDGDGNVRAHCDSSGNWTGIGGGETAFAYVNFNGTGTVSIRDDFNVSSITDNQTGDYSVNFSSSASSSNYTAAGHGGDPSQDGEPFWTQALSTSAYRGWLKVPNSGRNDRQYVMCTIHGG
jgi:hypothetical protein